MFSFTRFSLPLSQTNSFDRTIVDYIDNNAFLRDFYEFTPSFEGVLSRIKSYSNPLLDRKSLKEILLKQYTLADKGEIPAKVQSNIELLTEEKTFAVTTGHQLVIAGGPLYVFFKIVSVIKLCDQLSKKFPEYRFVPVHWMATEDHDIEEISKIVLHGKSIKWESDYKGMTGKMPLNGIEKVLDEILPSVSSSSNGEELSALLKKSYQNQPDLGTATRVFLNSFFSSYGLVIIDGNEPAFKKKFSNVILDELFHHSGFNIVNETNKQIEKNYPPQVNPREINLFYSQAGYRERIVQENDEFIVLNTDIRFTAEQIKGEVNNHPERFSPNVILRPLYQESILPDVAYVGGPAEIAYWLQLKQLFAHHQLPMPVLVLRGTALILEENIVSKMQKLGITREELFLNVDEILKKFVQKNDGNISFENIQQIISDQFNTLSETFEAVDVTLKSSVEAEKQKVNSSIRTLEEKLIRAKKKKSEIEVNQIRKLKDKIFPDGNLQERVETVIPFFLKYGYEFTDALLQQLDPLEKSFIILEENKA